MRNLLPASVLLAAGCAPPAEAPVGEADTGVDARLDSSPTWLFAPGNLGMWPDVADIDADGDLDLVMGRDGAGPAILTFLGAPSSPYFPGTPSASVSVAESSTWGIEERLALGDYNCDGEIDAAIGIRGAFTGQSNEGQLWFYAGQGGGVFASAPTWVLESNLANERMGTDLIAFDANHDGCTDLLAAGDLNLRAVLGGSAGPTLSGTTWGYGQTSPVYGLENLGDVNGDANEDFAWCDGYFSSGLGRVVVFLGTGTGFPVFAHRSYTGASGDNLCGGQQSTRGVTGGDVDGDGYDDVIIGAPGAGSGNGRVDVYRGGPTGLPSTPTWVLAGPADGVNGRFGTMVLSGFDQNGDTYDDLVIGEPTRDLVVSNYRGVNWMYPGSPLGPLPGSPTWSLSGTNLSTFGAYGHSAYAMGDVNNDSFDDVLLMDEGYQDLEIHLILGQGDADADNDGAGDPIDCDDANPLISPLATEIVGNGLDENCNGWDDCYQDIDKDTYGTILVKNDAGGCLTISSEASKGGDCDDNISSVHPNAGETYADGKDQDCDGGDLCRPDADLDKHGILGDKKSTDLDCLDAGESTTIDDYKDDDPTIYTGATEIVGDGIDQNCNGGEICYVDGDKDGFGSKVMVGSTDLDCVDVNESKTDDDCNDGNALYHPGATDVPADNLDYDCNKGDMCYADADGDKQGGSALVSSPNMSCLEVGEAAVPGDCKDDKNTIFSGAVEAPADGVDQDCDLVDTCYKDVDLDKHGVSTTFLGNDMDCVDAGESAAKDDCDDADGDRFPGNLELVGDGVDQDCVQGDTCYKDVDVDTFGGTVLLVSSDLDCDDAGESELGTDCDDAVKATYPGASEVLADGIDQDCDKGDTCFTDSDGDTYGTVAPLSSVNLTCTDAGEAVRALDCKDDNNGIHPAAQEVIGDGIDQNCDGNDTCLLDGDGDGFGGSAPLACGSGGVTKAGDCDDSAKAVNPDGVEVTADGVDQDCDGLESCYLDIDKDGSGGSGTGDGPMGCGASGVSSSKTDCNDADATFGPTVPDVPGELLDRNCDGAFTCFADGDKDGFAGAATTSSADADCADAGEGIVTNDCRDADAASYPGAPEIGGDGIDQDCDGDDECWLDDDGDGYGVTQVPTATLGCKSAGESIAGGDCDDADASVYEGATEVVGNTRDDDCDGFASCYEDLDGDGFGGAVEDLAGGTVLDPVVCADEGDVSVGGDCDDDDGLTRPDVTGEPFGEDRDCDGVVVCLADLDGDGFGSVEVEIDVEPGETPGCFVVQGDCDDGDANTSPAATEVAGNGDDEDCDGSVTCFVDGDGDGFGTSATLPTTDCAGAGVAATSDDCDDTSAASNPGGLEVCDGLDNDCDGEADEDSLWADPADPSTCSEDTVKFCGCASGGGSPIGGLALALGLLLGRRRR